MSTYVVAVVPGELAAERAVHTLAQLHREGSITLYDATIVQRLPDGTLAATHREPTPAVATGIGAVLGALFGVFGGPRSRAIGLDAASARFGGGTVLPREVSDELLEDVAEQLLPGHYAVLAEVSEPWTASIDTRMAPLGATVLREQRTDDVNDLLARHAEAYGTAAGEGRERLQRIADKARQRLGDTRRELQQKLIALDEQATQAPQDTRAQIEERIVQIRRDFGQREHTLLRALELARDTQTP